MIYVASQLKHRDKWLYWREQINTPIISSWLLLGDVLDKTALWEMCVREVKESQHLIVYAEDGDSMKAGAFVEMGVALGNDIPVTYVGPDVFGSSIYHPLVLRTDTLEKAFRKYV